MPSHLKRSLHISVSQDVPLCVVVVVVVVAFVGSTIVSLIEERNPYEVTVRVSEGPKPLDRLR